MSDPYNPHEAGCRITRQALEAAGRHGFGMALATKSDLVARDADVLASLAARAPVLVKITITAADDALAGRIEPCAPLSSLRLSALRILADKGFFAGVLLMPLLPFLTDTEANVRNLVRLAAAHGARFVYPMYGVTLRENQRDYFYKRLDALFPGLKQQYMRTFGTAYLCRSPREERLKAVLEEECRTAGLLCRMEEIIRAYAGKREQTIWLPLR